MNIFFLDNCPVTAAQMHCDKHVCKMIVEYAQMLSTAHRILDGQETIRTSLKGRKLKYWAHENTFREDTLYKPTHVNHPSTVWVRESKANYVWLTTCLIKLCDIFIEKRDKVHATDKKLRYLLQYVPDNIKTKRFEEPPLCMPDRYKCDDGVLAYRKFYIAEKSSFAKYVTFNERPEWFPLQNS